MGEINLEDIIFSEEVMNTWHDNKLIEKIKAKKTFTNKKSV